MVRKIQWLKWLKKHECMYNEVDLKEQEKKGSYG